MNYCQGIVTGMKQHAGCLEVSVSGPHPGVFAIDNCLVWGIVDAEGADWIGRAVEYADGHMRFQDTSGTTGEQPPLNSQGSTRDLCSPTAS
jgi:hypothetical protein